jgi:hypothetical protein
MTMSTQLQFPPSGSVSLQAGVYPNNDKADLPADYRYAERHEWRRANEKGDKERVAGERGLIVRAHHSSVHASCGRLYLTHKASASSPSPKLKRNGASMPRTTGQATQNQTGTWLATPRARADAAACKTTPSGPARPSETA